MNFAYGMDGANLYVSVKMQIVMSSRRGRWFWRSRWSEQVSETELIWP